MTSEIFIPNFYISNISTADSWASPVLSAAAKSWSYEAAVSVEAPSLRSSSSSWLTENWIRVTLTRCPASTFSRHGNSSPPHLLALEGPTASVRSCPLNVTSQSAESYSATRTTTTTTTTESNFFQQLFSVNVSLTCGIIYRATLSVLTVLMLSNGVLNG